MSTVAQLFPARQQPDGTIWYRSGSGKQDGWSTNLALADPSYRAEDAPAPIAHHADPWPCDAELDAASGASYHYVVTEDQVIDAAGGVDLLGTVVADMSETAATVLHTATTTTTEEPTAMTALTNDGDIDTARYTEWMRYPLPPEPPRFKAKFNGYRQYLLPAPQTGRPAGFSRATTISDTLDDTFGLSRWKRRETAGRVLELAMLARTAPNTEFYGHTAVSLFDRLMLTYESAQKVGDIDTLLDLIDNVMGGADSRELGECVHAWLEALDLGQVLYRDVPDFIRPYADAYRAILARFGLIALPQYVERIVLNDQGQETVAGMIDRIYQIVTTGDLVMGDIKTSKTLEYSWLPFAVQVGGVYGWATQMLSPDGEHWDDMPKLMGVPHPSDEEPDEREPFAVLVHIPSDQPERAQAVTIDLVWGAEAMVESLQVRQLRREAKKAVPRHAIPIPSATALRYAEARLALSSIESAEDGNAIYESYQDVWDDDLTEFAGTISELL